MTTAQVVKTSVTENNNSPIQDYVHPDDHTQPTYKMTLGHGFQPFHTSILFLLCYDTMTVKTALTLICQFLP